MAIAATETTSLVAFTLPGTPYSVRMARFYIRAALGYHDLSGYAEDVETVVSELAINAIAHADAPSHPAAPLHTSDREDTPWGHGSRRARGFHRRPTFGPDPLTCAPRLEDGDWRCLRAGSLA